MISVIYPGTFDPVTNGHLDLINRSLNIFDRVIVGVAANPGKGPLFTTQERVELIKKATADCKNVEVEAFDNLLIDFCAKHGVNVVIRGLRAVSDFEFEFQMTQMNRKMNDKVETVFMMPSDEFTFISSKLIKEVARLGGDVSELVPTPVIDALNNKFKGS